jgi:hypothetical protein
MLRTALMATAIAVMPTVVLALVPPISPGGAPSIVVPALQAVDPCYKKCFLDAKGKNGAWKSRCRRFCNANPVKKCQDKCWLKNGNDPKGLNACLTRCAR